jgi:hypothetical protein
VTDDVTSAQGGEDATTDIDGVDERQTDEEADEEPIRAKVAQILTVKDLVLNKGSDHGVYVGMQFVILNRNAKDIVDPDTGKVIGSVPVAKTIVKAVSVQDQMSIARTFRSTDNTLLALAMFASGSAREETLRTKERSAVQELDEADSYVKRGDEAVEVTDPDDFLIPPF